MKTIAIANQKGGTGKTTTAYNLGIALTQQGYRVLMVDFDPQGNLSCYCGIPPEQDLEQTITELLMKVAYEKPLSHRECVYQSKRTDDSAPQVDFIPSNLRLASFELAMGTMMCREVLLKTCLEQYSSQYDYCIIDCSPSVGLLLTNALSAANEVIIPMQAQPFSVVGMSQLTNSISSVQRKINPGLHIRGVLLTMTQHTKVSEHYAHDVRAKYGRTLHVFTTEIPYNVKVQESQALVTTRELKQYGVEVYFVNDDIWTMRGDGEVRLTIMASLAQDESRKMSERTKAGIQTSQKKGTYVAGPTPFGYKRDKKAHTLVVQESQAETVRKIFAWYADGINGTEIAQTLTQEGAPNKSGMPQWSARQVLSITKNTIYKGYLTYNKSHIDDFLSHKSIKNSEQDYILVKGSFEPIISEELWDKCQRRRHAWQSYKDGNITQAYLYGKSEHADKWACRLFCGCGARMRAFRAEKDIVRYICYQRSLRNIAPKCSAPNVQAWKLELMAREIYKNVWQDYRQDILEEYQQEQENRAANSEKVEEALSWQESFPNDEISREFLDRFVPRIFSIDGQKFIWELNLFQESCTVQCNVRGTYNYHSISAEKIMPGKTKAKKGDGAVNRILEDANSTRFWVHTYDDDPISRLPSSRLAADLPASITIKLNYEQARAYRNSRGYVLWPGNWKDLTVKVVL